MAKAQKEQYEYTMKLINITFAVSPADREEFISHIKSDFIPALIGAGYYSPLLSCVAAHEHEENDNCLSFALQMRAPSADVHARFMADEAAAHFRRMAEKWEPDFALFITELNVIYDPDKVYGRSC